MTFNKELEQLLNKYSKENQSDTPDFILCDFILGCLNAFNSATNIRDDWYGFESLSKKVAKTTCSQRERDG